MPEPVLLVDKTDGIATLTLNRPEKRNALSLELRILFQEAIEDIRTNDDISVVILTGAGNTFCAGLDLTEMGDPEFRRKENTVTDPATLLRSIRQPVIGAIDGLAITGGLEISVCCDVLLATPETKFADTHAQVGIVPSWGLSQRLSVRQANWRRVVGESPTGGRRLTTTSTASRALASVRMLAKRR